MKKSELKNLIKEVYKEYISEQEDEEDVDFEDTDEQPAETADEDGESEAQEAAPKEKIEFEGKKLDMLVDVNKNPTKKGLKIQFLSDEPFSKEDRAKLVSSLQSYLDEGLSEFIKGVKLNIDSDPDVPNKTKTIGFTIKIGDLFELVSKVFSNKGEDEESEEL